MDNQTTPNGEHEWKRERWELLRHINALTDKPMIALAFVWLALLIIDFTNGLDPLLQTVSNVIWALFILDFVIEFIIAPHKTEYLRGNALTAISLVLPAFRIFRIFRAVRLLRAARTVRVFSLVRVVSSLNRGMRALQDILGRRGLGLVVALTIIVVFAGAAGMLALESPEALLEAGALDELDPEAGLNSYGEAVWWTAMIMTSLGSEYWPQTAEGRILCWLLSVYALAVFGYITATIASYFIGSDRRTEPRTATAGEVRALREEIRTLQAQLAQGSPGQGSA